MVVPTKGTNDVRNSAETLEFITRAFDDCGIKIDIRRDAIHLGSSLTYYPYDILLGSEKISHAQSKKTGSLKSYIEQHFGVGFVRIYRNGIEIPTNPRVQPSFDKLLQTDGWRMASENKECIPILLGESVNGDAFVCELSHGDDANHIQMLIGGCLCSGKTNLLKSIVTALHTCRTANEIEIYLLHLTFDFSNAFSGSSLIRHEQMVDDVVGALEFMRNIDTIVMDRLRRLSADPAAKLRDILVIIDDIDYLRMRDAHEFAQLKKLVEKCVSFGRSAHVHFIISTQNASRDVLNTDFFTTFFCLRYQTTNYSYRLLRGPDAVRIARGEGFFYGTYFLHRVQVPCLSSEDIRKYVQPLLHVRNKQEHATIRCESKNVDKSSLGVHASQDERICIGRSISSDSVVDDMRTSKVQNVCQGEAQQIHEKESSTERRDCSQIELLPIPPEKTSSLLERVFGRRSAEECFNEGARCYNKKRYKKALKMFRRSADMGCVDAQYRAGWILAWGEFNIRQDGELAKDYLTKAAKSGSVGAMVQLAFLYEDGRGVAKDSEQAMRWFKAAAERGDWAGAEGVRRLRSRFTQNDVEKEPKLRSEKTVQLAHEFNSLIKQLNEKKTQFESMKKMLQNFEVPPQFRGSRTLCNAVESQKDAAHCARQSSDCVSAVAQGSICKLSDSVKYRHELQEYFAKQGLTVDVEISSIDKIPSRRRCVIKGNVDAKRVFAILSSFFDGDRLTVWMPVAPKSDRSFVIDYVLPSASVEDKLAMQVELEKMAGIGDEQRLITPEPSPGSDQAYAPLKYEFYDAIESGKKTIEYREYNEGWARKLLSRPMKTIKFSRGYGQSGKAPRQMVYAIKKIGIVDAHSGTEIPARHPDGTLVCDGDIDEDFMPTHFAIHLGARLS